jgi:hypothetical protein
MSQSYVAVFAELILTPFRHVELVRGIVQGDFMTDRKQSGQRDL